MTALSIRNMNWSMGQRELLLEAQMKSVSSPATDYQPSYYWHIFRKSKAKGKGTRWVFVRDFSGTKADVTKFWLKWFADGQYRLKCVLKYPTKEGR